MSDQILIQQMQQHLRRTMRDKQYAFTVEALGFRWDVYHTQVRGRDASIGFRLDHETKTAVIAIFQAGHVVPAEAQVLIEDGGGDFEPDTGLVE